LKSGLSGQKQLRIIAIVFGLYSTFVLINQLQFLRLMFQTELNYGVNTIVFLASIVLMPFASLLFGIKKKLGWFILAFYLVRYIINMVKVVITYMPTSDHLGTVDSSAFYNFTFLIGVGIFLFAFWAINKKSVFQQFKIKNSTRYAFFVIILILTVLTGW